MTIKEFYFYAKKAYPTSIQDAIRRSRLNELKKEDILVYLYNERPPKTDLSYIFPSLETHVNEHVLLVDSSKGIPTGRACHPTTAFYLDDIDLTVIHHRRIYFSRKAKRGTISQNHAACA